MGEKIAHRNLCFALSWWQSCSPFRYHSLTVGRVGRRGTLRQIVAVPQLFNVPGHCLVEVADSCLSTPRYGNPGMSA